MNYNNINKKLNESIKKHAPKIKQKTPKEAEILFTSNNFKVYRWRQTDFAGNVHNFEKVKVNSSVYIIPVTEDNEIIIAEELQPGRKTSIGLLGGRVENNESILKAVLRELYEESNITPSEIKFIGASRPFEKIEWIQYYFAVKATKTSEFRFETNLDGERIDLRKVSLPKFITILENRELDNPYLNSIFVTTYYKAGLEALTKYLQDDFLKL